MLYQYYKLYISEKNIIVHTLGNHFLALYQLDYLQLQENIGQWSRSNRQNIAAPRQASIPNMVEVLRQKSEILRANAISRCNFGKSRLYHGRICKYTYSYGNCLLGQNIASTVEHLSAINVKLINPKFCHSN